MGRSFKSRALKYFSRLKKIVCCCTTKNEVAPLEFTDCIMPPRILETAVDSDLKLNTIGAEATPDTSCNEDIHPPRSSSGIFRVEAAASDEAVSSNHDIAGLNKDSVCCLLNSKIRVINDLSDLPEDTPLPFIIRSAETNTVQGVAIRGSYAQDNFGPMFRNTQCTSMAYQSLAYKKVIGEPDTWNYRDIDAILQQGHLLHTHFRNVMKLSINEDNRIAVHELPSSYEIQVLPPSSYATPSTIPEGGKVKMTSSTAIDGPYAYASQEIADSFGNIAPEFPIFLLQTFTTDNADEVNIILTIGDFSMALWRRRNDHVIWLFDSHRRASTGLRHIVPIWESDYYDNGAALARSFTRVSELLEHITELYGENFLYNVRFFNLEMVEDNNAAVAKTDADENGVDVTICDKETSPESSRSGTSFEENEIGYDNSINLSIITVKLKFRGETALKEVILREHGAWRSGERVPFRFEILVMWLGLKITKKLSSIVINL